ncbi:MAG: class I SAM-dependent methyltransferase [Vicinamibacterales bacterium]
MNRLHHWLCRSAFWRRHVSDELVPWVLEGLSPGRDVLEIGPGPGAATPVLQARADRLICLELDEGLAGGLALQWAGRVGVVRGDATCLPFRDASMDAVVALTMLHHVPSVDLQDRLLHEAVRVLRPGGLLAGSDSLASIALRAIHVFDTFLPVDPRTFTARLAAAGLASVSVDHRRHTFRFRGRRPACDG